MNGFQNMCVIIAGVIVFNRSRRLFRDLTRSRRLFRDLTRSRRLLSDLTIYDGY